MMKKTIRIGTRKSPLALIQTDLVIKKINQSLSNISCEVIPITTSGDLIQNKALYDIGGKALFLKEIEKALLERKIDIAVHSLKDVPGKIPDELIIAAVLEREDPRDVFICFNYNSIEELPYKAVVGTSAVRRAAFLKQIRPDLEIVIFRGNVDSRIKKLINKEVDATILAYAGLLRLKFFDSRYCHIIDPQQMLPAIGQGTIAIETCKDNSEMLELCNKINHLPTFKLIELERVFLEYLDANCRTPVAAYSTYINPQVIKTDLMLSDIEYRKMVFSSEVIKIDVENSYEVGIKAAKKMLTMLG